MNGILQFVKGPLSTKSGAVILPPKRMARSSDGEKQDFQFLLGQTSFNEYRALVNRFDQTCSAASGFPSP